MLILREETMTINDVIREAKSEHEVYFLLTAYVEAVRYVDRMSLLPPSVRELPLSGMDDVKARFDGLKAELGQVSSGQPDIRSLAIVKESADILGDALARLQWLEQEKHRQGNLHA
jgi:hypothetical protein